MALVMCSFTIYTLYQTLWGHNSKVDWYRHGVEHAWRD